MKRKWMLVATMVLMVAMILSLSLAGCKTAATTTTAAAETTAAAAETTAAAAETTAAPVKKLNVGFSNGLITHSWRTQMTADLVQEFGYYKGQGIVDKLSIQHAGFDVDLQISQIRNLINSGIDLLLINPNSLSALDPVIEEAKEKGILVFVFDQPVTSDLAYQIVPDQIVWMSALAEYVIGRIGGKGNVVYMSGYDGSPANTDRDTGVTQTLAKYPDVKLLTKVNGNWDPSTAQQAMATVLAAFPKIDAVMSQDGMCLGVVKAFQAANRAVPIMNGEGMIPFMDIWKELRDKEGFEAYAIANGPGFTVNYALGVGLRMLQGKQIKDGFFNRGEKQAYVTLGPDFDNSTLDKIYNDHITTRGITEYIDNWPSQEELDALFK
ncbi:MAG: substrate-binding domain-containing protein [Candidatus Humimicrobiaceae bacterium]